MSAKGSKALVKSDAGAYVAWSGTDQPELAAEGLGCGLLLLRPLSFALPHYADSPKFGYVLRGSGVAGVLPVATEDASAAARERVVRLEAGDVIAVRTGDVSWWYNDSDGDTDDLSILFLGDTGALSARGHLLLLSRRRQRRPRRLRRGPPRRGMVWGDEGAGRRRVPEPASRPPRRPEHEADRRLPARARQERARRERRPSRRRDPEDGHRGGPGGAGRPRDQRSDRQARSRRRASAVGVTRGAAQAVYVARGSARVQVSSSVGGETLLLDEEAAAGSVLVLPRFAVALISAGADGAEWVSLIKSARPEMEQLTGDGSVLDGLTAQVVQASLSVAPELVELLGGRSAEPSN
ncbi:hypothetical protein ZWY2020_051194 [Hordeum vulgare]|nr:hypothetical protein ZWY2020_051194 [Hordeum vulgare]